MLYPVAMSAFGDSWMMLKMNTMGGGMPEPPSMGPSMDKPDKLDEEYSHKDLDAEALIDFLIDNFGMDYREAKTMVVHHKSKEMSNNSRIKGMKKPSENGPDMGPGPSAPSDFSELSMM